jgi:putative chitinase
VIDRDVYFDAVREVLFDGALTQQQVDGQSVILALWDQGDTGTPMSDLRWLAYMLATTYWECGKKMWPIEEWGKGEGHDYPPYYGRGFVQLTWEENYRKASAALGLIDDRDMVTFPHLALDSLIAARVMFRGMAEGWFTGKRLNDYFNDVEDDAKGARQIINGNDCDDEIAAIHEAFLEAVTEAETGASVEPLRRGEVVLTTPPGTRVVVNGLLVEP